MISSRLGCSSIGFRHQPLPEALRTIGGLGFEEIDRGALPGVCDHVPSVLDAAAVEQVAAGVHHSGLRVPSVNGDVGDLHVVLDEAQRAERADHLDMLLELTAAVGVDVLVLPCAALDHEPIRNLSIGSGEADFAAGLRAPERVGYTGHLSLELETRDITHDQRPAAARAAAGHITSLL